MQKIIEELKNKRIKVRENVPLARYTSLGVGGPADVLVEPTSTELLLTTLAILKEQRTPYKLIGNGSNLLVSDQGYRGVIVVYARGKEQLVTQGSTIIAAGNMSLVSLAKQAARRSLSGLEFAAGIPGTVGGGVAMNVGAHGSEIADILVEVRVLTEAGELECWSKDECGLIYRDSRIKSERATVLSASFDLLAAEKNEILARMKAYNATRQASQPLGQRTAGSIFKNPQGDYAGRLIEELGLKGYSRGDAQVSSKHANFIVNRGSASATDIVDLIEYIQEKTYEKFKIRLETEVEFLGEF